VDWVPSAQSTFINRHQPKEACMRAHNKLTPVLGVAVALVAAACASSPQTSTPSSTLNTGATSTLVAASVTAADPENNRYSTKTFNRPFDITLPKWAQSATPDVEEPNFVTWEAPDVDRAVRFLIPVNVYPPDGSGAIPSPDDYLAYLLGQTDHGAHFADMSKTTVGGLPATILTASTDSSLDGSIGCPAEHIEAADCFGLQPDLVLRLAVVDTGDKPLLIWLRNNTVNQTTEVDSFEQMLTTVQFKDRAVEASPLTTTAP
jgi:hypothetical protein